MLKKVLISLGVVVILLGGGVFYVLSNLDEIVRTAIEDYGSEAVGSQVSVGAVEISLREGSVSIYNFSIANPPGFSDEAMLRFTELGVALDLSNISAERVGIVSIVSTDPFVSYERANGTTNIDVVRERLAGEPPQEPEDAGAESEMALQIDDVSIRNIQASISDDRLRNPVQVSLGDITLQNLSGTPAEIAQQVLTPIMTQLAGSAAQAFLNLGRDLFTEGAQELRNRVEEGRQQLEDSVGEDIREGLGNLLGN